MERRILGTEKVILLDGTDREITIKAVGFYEKLKLQQKYTKTQFINGYSYKVVDEVAIMEEIFRKCIEGANIEELDYNAQEIYNKYFNKSGDDTKKSETSETMQMGSE